MKRFRYTNQLYLRELSRKKRLFLRTAITGATLPLFPSFSSLRRRIFARKYRVHYNRALIRSTITVNIIAARKVEKDQDFLFLTLEIISRA